MKNRYLSSVMHNLSHLHSNEIVFVRYHRARRCIKTNELLIKFYDTFVIVFIVTRYLGSLTLA